MEKVTVGKYFVINERNVMVFIGFQWHFLAFFFIEQCMYYLIKYICKIDNIFCIICYSFLDSWFLNTNP